MEDELTPQQEKALAALLSSPSIREAAKACDSGETTLYRWLREDPFKRAYAEARRRHMEQATTVLQQASTEAVETLRKNLSCGVPAAEISAARTILDMGFRGVEIQELEARLSAIEEAERAEKDGRQQPVQ